MRGRYDRVQRVRVAGHCEGGHSPCHSVRKKEEFLSCKRERGRCERHINHIDDSVAGRKKSKKPQFQLSAACFFPFLSWYSYSTTTFLQLYVYSRSNDEWLIFQSEVWEGVRSE